jgi:hypothetical protein
MLLFSVSCYASTLEDVIKKVSVELAPKKTIGAIGYEVEFREDHGYYWININRVVYKCRKETNSYLEKGKITTIIEQNCRGFWELGELYQISCKTDRGLTCKKKLAKEVNSDVILEMTKRNIKDVDIK